MTAKKIKAGILLFPGTNCEKDLEMILKSDYAIESDFLWHTESFSVEHDIYFVPGGFSYGDYLRSGSLASMALSIQSLKEAAQKEILVAGICNGFQILTETHMLPGALVKNKTLKHIARWVKLEGAGRWANEFPENYSLPVSHSEGNYLASDEELASLQENNQILLRYREVLNGSTDQIASISSKNGRVIGLMPHPERAIYPQADTPASATSPGKLFFDKILSMV